ncbi:MAG TPA: hypothetical protein VFN57_19180 [Thermomicrobiaceae bacterium]|nr:hypothetical protein [Thermomicrobiaceae bacterium]
MDEQAEEKTSPWPFVAILVGFKIWTLGLIIAFTGSWGVVWFLVSSHVLWIVLGAVALWSPAVFWTRLVRVRRRRHELQRAEWQVEDPSHHRFGDTFL